MNRSLFAVVCGCLVLFLFLVSPVSAETDVADMALLQGYDAFLNEDWVSSLFFFRKAVSSGNAPEETWYMLILSEMFAEDYESAVEDCNTFVANFPSGEYYSFALYQRGRALYHLNRKDESVSQLTEFCHLYPDHELYAPALFWIAESFFDEYNYSASKVLYERIVSDFPRDAKASEAEERLRAIGQAEREEKLLYLLKVTGEEYLAAKEEYERELSLYRSEDALGLHDHLQQRTKEVDQLNTLVDELQLKNKAQQDLIDELENKNRELQITAEEARRMATDVASAASKAQEEAVAKAQQEAEAKAAEEVAKAVEETARAKEEAAEAAAKAAEYSGLKELKAKAAELQRLLEEKSIRSQK